MMRHLNKLVKVGILSKDRTVGGKTKFKFENHVELKGRSIGYKLDSESDRRSLPRFGKKYINQEKLIYDILNEFGEPISEDELVVKTMNKITEIKKKDSIFRKFLTRSQARPGQAAVAPP